MLRRGFTDIVSRASGASTDFQPVGRLARRSNVLVNNPMELKRATSTAILLNRGHKFLAADFDVRAEMSPEEACSLVSRLACSERPPTFSLSRDGIRSLTYNDVRTCLKENCHNSTVLRALRFMAYFSCLVAPFVWSMESLCELTVERIRMFYLKLFHLAQTCIYLVGALIIAWGTIESGRGIRWMALDMIIPIALIAELTHLFEVPTGTPSVLQWLWLLNMVKIWRMWASSSTGMVSYGFSIQCFFIFAKLCFFVHAFACFFGVIALHEWNVGKATWADNILSPEGPQSCSDFYVYGLYFIGYTVTSIGYGDIVPVNWLERCCITVTMVISQLYMAQLFADLNFINQLFSYWESRYHQQMTLTKTALDHIGAPEVLRQRVLRYQDFSYEVHRECCAKEVFKNMPRVLREELEVFLNFNLLIKVPFLQQLSKKAMRDIVGSLSDETFLPSDFIMRPGDEGSELYFMRDGVAAVFVGAHTPLWADDHVRLLTAGNYFGEVALLTGQARSSWVMARAYCICMLLSKSTIDEIIDRDPTCLPILVSSVKQYLGLKSHLTWKDVSGRLIAEFQSEEEAYEQICSGVDGEAPGGVITWSRYKTMMNRLNVSQYDQKLLWADMFSHGRAGDDFRFDDLLDFMEDVWSKDEAEAPSTPVPASARERRISDVSRYSSITSQSSQASSPQHGKDDLTSAREFCVPGKVVDVSDPSGSHNLPNVLAEAFAQHPEAKELKEYEAQRKAWRDFSSPGKAATGTQPKLRRMSSQASQASQASRRPSAAFSPTTSRRPSACDNLAFFPNGEPGKENGKDSAKDAGLVRQDSDISQADAGNVRGVVINGGAVPFHRIVGRCGLSSQESGGKEASATEPESTSMLGRHAPRSLTRRVDALDERVTSQLEALTNAVNRLSDQMSTVVQQLGNMQQLVGDAAPPPAPQSTSLPVTQRENAQALTSSSSLSHGDISHIPASRRTSRSPTERRPLSPTGWELSIKAKSAPVSPKGSGS